MAKKSTDYKREFNAEKYDRLYVTVPKGHKAEIQACADSQGISINKLVEQAIDERMERISKTKPEA